MDLPTDQEVNQALSRFLDDPTALSEDSKESDDTVLSKEEPWRKIVTHLLTRATEPQPPAAAAATTTAAAGGGGENDAANKKQNHDLVGSILECLLGALDRYHDAKLKNGTKPSSTDNNNNDIDTDYQEGTPESILVDALWLKGIMLEAPATSNTPSSTGTGATKATVNEDSIENLPGYKALCTIIRGLVYGIEGKEYKSLLPTKLFLTSLEPSLLASSGILDNNSPVIFLRKLRKLNTDMYYRQKKVNLLQEESEGYAKLLSFLVTLPSLDFVDDGDAKSNNDSSTDKSNLKMRTNNKVMLEKTTARIRELIGVFDLDPNRVLDLTLDALEGQVALLLKEQGSKYNTYDWSKIVNNAPNYATTIHILLSIIDMFPKENVTHLIGFKFSSYAVPSAGNKTAVAGGAEKTKGGVAANTKSNANSGSSPKIPDGPCTTAGMNSKQTPRSIYLTTSLLAVHSMLSLPALLTHMQSSATKSDLLKDYALWKKEFTMAIKKMGVVSLNSKEKGQDKKEQQSHSVSDTMRRLEVSCESNQIVQLLLALLETGLYWKDIVSFLSGEVDCKADQISGLEALVACCAMHAPLRRRLCEYTQSFIDSFYCTKIEDVGMLLCRPEQSGASDDHSSSLLPLELLNDPLSLDASTTLLGFCQVLEGPLKPMIETGCISYNPMLYCKICRIFCMLLKEQYEIQDGQNLDPSMEMEKPITDLLEKFLVPSLSHFPYNPSISSELWSILSILPYQTRYALYSLWTGSGLEKAALRGMSTNRKPLAQVRSEVSTAIETRYLLKRTSKDNIRDMGRHISKASHNNPLVVFTLILNQIESYDNLILMMVDTFKFVGVLSLDVMGYCLLVSLGGGISGTQRSKLKDDGVSSAQWLSSLETFTGAFYKKFTDVELGGLLSYLIKQVRNGQLLELGVLTSLLKMVGGYDFADCESTTVQLEGRCGSQRLKRETSHFGIIAKFNEKSSIRLRSTLSNNGYGIVFLILISQLTSRVLFESSDDSQKKIKLIGNFFDSCQKTGYILQTCLSDFSDDSGFLEKYAKALPTLNQLCEKYGVKMATAWALCRPLIRVVMFSQEDTTEKNKVPAYLERFNPSSPEVRSTYHSMLPEKCWKYLSPLLFERFFSFSLYDLICPEERYRIEIARLTKEVDRLSQLRRGGKGAEGTKASMAAAAAAAGKTDREIREATNFTKAHEQELDRCTRTSALLTNDMATQKKHCEFNSQKLISEKDLLLPHIDDQVEQLQVARYFLTHFVYPRCLLSPDDALYCSHFVTTLHQMGTAGFFTLQYFNCLISAVIGAVYSITEAEAGNLGILFEETWKLISSWRYDEALYRESVVDKPGATWSKYIDDPTNDGSNNLYCMEHSEFVKHYNKWHRKLTDAFVGCLKSKEYMYTRTALILLTRIVNYYPSKSSSGDNLLEALKPLQGEDNPMQDVRAMAQAYSAQLVKVRDSGEWKEEDSEAAKARKEKDKQLQEEKKKKAEKKLEEMKQESEKIDREIGVGWGRHDRRSHSNRPTNAPNFTPAPTGARPQGPLRPSDPRNPTRSTNVGSAEKGREENSLKGRWEAEKKVGGKRGRSPDPRGGTDFDRKRGRHQSSDRGPVSSDSRRQGNRDYRGGGRR